MPLIIPKQTPKYEQVVKRQIVTQTRDDIPCQLSCCQKCSNFSLFRPILESSILLCDCETLLKYSTTVSVLQSLQLVLLQSTSIALEQLNRQIQRQTLSRAAVIYADQISSNTHTDGHDETDTLLKVRIMYEQHGAKVILLRAGDFEQCINSKKFFTEQNYLLLSDYLDMTQEQFLQVEQSKLGYSSIYMPHVTNVNELIERNQIVRGTFKAYGKAASGIVFTAFGVVTIKNKWCANRSIDGDVVAIRLYNCSKTQIGDERVDENLLYPMQDDVYAQIDKNTANFGVIVAIIERKRTLFTGSLKEKFDYTLLDELLQIQKSQNLKFCAQFSSMCQTAPDFFIRSSNDISALVGHRLQVELISWDAEQYNGTVSFRQDLGEIGNRDVEAKAIFLEHNIHTNDLEVKCFLDELPVKIIDDSINMRVNLIDAPVCSVDPPGCKDVDDALHYRQLNDALYNEKWKKWIDEQVILGKMSKNSVSQICELRKQGQVYEIGVHIADVTHYVPWGGSIDQEARIRGTSVYLADRRIDMLPKMLTESVCSIVSEGPRFCFSVLYLFTKQGEQLCSRFCKTVIRNRANLTYQEAWDLICDETSAIQQRYNTTELKQELAAGLRGLFEISKIFKQKRYESGCITLESAEVEFELDAQKNPTNVRQHSVIPTMSMVEELMLLANVSAAKLTYEVFSASAVLRRHPAPSEQIFNDLKQKLKVYGVELDTTSSRSVRDSMENAGPLKKILQTLVTRCMQLAKYCSAGSLPYEDFYHYGLALPLYTHFTSPIRRYADDLVHRLLSAAIGWEKMNSALMQNDFVEEICRNLNQRKEEADRAGRDADRVFGVLFMLRTQLKSGHTVKTVGEVTHIGKRANILLRDFGVEVECAVQTVSEDKMSGTVNGIEIRVFEKVNVNVGFDFEHPWDFKLQVEVEGV